ncbi:hypothetical protein [Nocardioides zeae]|uniref:DUF2127 domain-containing protein n=1 Tax=Nocardioides zeae TaxID=1457234 RepID=A0A6P0HCV8_9ACTN|nr:hypothetical protein [Nocardioides zeae]NEN76673.1 hypothetical protein [Nocardioides zeae]
MTSPDPAGPSDRTAASLPGPVPTALRIGVGVIALQALVVVGYALTELVYGAVERSGTAVAVAVFLGAYGVGIGWAAWLVLQCRSSARSPLVLAQLLHLGLAWNMRDEPTTLAAVVLAVSAVLALLALFWRSSHRWLLAGDPDAAGPLQRV